MTSAVGLSKIGHLRVILCYKNFAAFCGISHIGLGVSAINTAKCLRSLGIQVEVWPIKNELELRQRLNLNASNRGKPITHVVVSAPWISTPLWSQLCTMFPETKFAMNCHSNVGFLQADSKGIELLREDLSLAEGVFNFVVGGNSKRFVEFIESTYGYACTYLPNLYFLDHLSGGQRPLWDGGSLRIGIFGATRALKNYLSAVGASIQIARSLKAQTEVYVSTEREDGPDTKRILWAVKKLVAGLPHIKIVPAPWCAWPEFRKLVGSMHLLIQPSYTESFNMVTADGVAEGVPSVVSDAITWAPDHWKADVDDVASIAKTGIYLIKDHQAASEGMAAIRLHNKAGEHAWLRYLLKEGSFEL